MVAVINDDEAEERADMTVMLLDLVVVVVVLSRVLRVKSSIMRRKMDNDLFTLDIVYTFYY